MSFTFWLVLILVFLLAIAKVTAVAVGIYKVVFLSKRERWKARKLENAIGEFGIVVFAICIIVGAVFSVIIFIAWLLDK
jgi:hypothetical protein